MPPRPTHSLSLSLSLSLALTVLSCAHPPALPPHPLQVPPGSGHALAPNKAAVVLFAAWNRFWDCAGMRNAQLEELSFARLPIEPNGPTLLIVNPAPFHSDPGLRLYVLEVDAGTWALDGLKWKVAQSITEIGHFDAGRDQLLAGGTPAGGTFQVAAGEAVYLGHFVIDCADSPPTPWRLYMQDRATFEAFAADFAREWPALPPLQYRLFETTRFGTPFALPK